jgi:hypothetical protein
METRHLTVHVAQDGGLAAMIGDVPLKVRSAVVSYRNDDVTTVTLEIIIDGKTAVIAGDA